MKTWFLSNWSEIVFILFSAIVGFASGRLSKRLDKNIERKEKRDSELTEENKTLRQEKAALEIELNNMKDDDAFEKTLEPSENNAFYSRLENGKRRLYCVNCWRGGQKIRMPLQTVGNTFLCPKCKVGGVVDLNKVEQSNDNGWSEWMGVF